MIKKYEKPKLIKITGKDDLICIDACNTGTSASGNCVSGRTATNNCITASYRCVSGEDNASSTFDSGNYAYEGSCVTGRYAGTICSSGGHIT